MKRPDRETVELIKASGLFDEPWYRERYPDVKMLGIDPVEHYLWLGAKLGRDPSPSFSTRAYLDAYADVFEANFNPLVHYTMHGLRERRHVSPSRSFKAAFGKELIEFSVIMPTKDRAHCICDAIDSLLLQTHSNFELIVVDDGSTDGTEALLRKKYEAEIQSKRIVLVRSDKPTGVCNARNIGLSVASKPWIAYLDSDNTVRPEFLETFASGVVLNPETRAFYANFKVQGSIVVGGKAFDLKELGRQNYIDIGVYCHSRECYEVLGGFDPSLRRLVDWELIYRYSKAFTPVHLPYVLMDYCNRDAAERITRSESYCQAKVQVHRKHRFRDTISIIVLSYNQEKYIRAALESVVKQKGWFTYEIIISDDGSTDRTPQIIADFCDQHKHLTRNISSPFNMGISANFKKCFEAASGEYIAVLEGDDFWESEQNLSKKLAFMRKNRDCSMVFSKTKMLFEKESKREVKFLERQEKLKVDKLNGQHFVDDPDMNLIVNFSSCMFKTDLMRQLPYEAYTHRLSEITVAFFLEKFGPLGYIDEPLTVYRHHGSGTWSGLNVENKLRSAMQIREIVKFVAAPKYQDAIQTVIQTKYLDRLKALGSKAA